MHLTDYIERTPVPEAKTEREQNITFRLTGNWLARWRLYMATTGEPRKSEVLRDCLSLLFACAATDARGNPVRIILKRQDRDGKEMPDEDLIEFLGLPTLLEYRKRRVQDANVTQKASS